MKKFLIFWIILFSTFKLFAWNLEDFDGCEWISDYVYQWMIQYNKPYDYCEFSFSFPKNDITFNDDYGTFAQSGMGAHICIYSAKKISETEIEILYAWKVFGEDGNDFVRNFDEVCKENELEKGKIIIKDYNTITFENRPYIDVVGYGKSNPIFYRVTVNPNKIKYKGVTNDSNVRIRKAPGLESVILGSVKKGTEVLIVDTVEVENKDGTKNKWYLVDIDKRPVSWICADYVSIKE